MKTRQTIKNIKRVSCRFDMDVPEERRAWQILQRRYEEPTDGKKQDYSSIIAEAMIGHYWFLRMWGIRTNACGLL